MNKEEFIKLLEGLKKSEQELKNARDLVKDIYINGFGNGYNKAIDEAIEIIKKGEN